MRYFVSTDGAVKKLAPSVLPSNLSKAGLHGHLLQVQGDAITGLVTHDSRVGSPKTTPAEAIETLKRHFGGAKKREAARKRLGNQISSSVAGAAAG